jgi:flagellar biosynthetic protein FliR
MYTIPISLSQLQPLFFIFLRVIAIVMTVPMLDSRNVPIIFKAGLAIALSLILYHQLDFSALSLQSNLIVFSIGVISEVLLGIIIGMAVKLVFAGIQLAGQLVGFQMGFSIANVMDPASSSQVPIIAQFNYIVAILVFLTLNAHHWFIKAMVESFRIIPPLQFYFSPDLMPLLMAIGGSMFVIAIKVGAPLIAVLLLTSVAMGLMARTVPQMNIFIVAMPLKIVVGIFFIGITLPFLVSFFHQTFTTLIEDLVRILKAIA